MSQIHLRAEVGDYVREVDIEEVGLPSKRLVYPFALLLLGLVIAGQLVRRRREQADPVPASGGSK